jgi:endonuclease V-like protein UPF0215 family
MNKGRIVEIRAVKPEIRVLGIDDGVFIPHTKGVVDVIGVVFRGGYWLDGIMRTQAEIDGMDATEKIASMIIESPHYDPEFASKRKAMESNREGWKNN